MSYLILLTLLSLFIVTIAKVLLLPSVIMAVLLILWLIGWGHLHWRRPLAYKWVILLDLLMFWGSGVLFGSGIIRPLLLYNTPEHVPVWIMGRSVLALSTIAFTWPPVFTRLRLRALSQDI